MNTADRLEILRYTKAQLIEEERSRASVFQTASGVLEVAINDHEKTKKEVIRARGQRDNAERNLDQIQGLLAELEKEYKIVYEEWKRGMEE